MINLHELANMPGYGKAEKVLRDHGKWRLTPQEQYDKNIAYLKSAIDDAESAIDDARHYMDRISQLEATQ